MKRRNERITALKILYALEFNPMSIEEQIDLYKTNIQEDVSEFATDIIRTTIKNKDELDELIKSQLHNWDFSRVGVIDKVLLRMALTELKYFPDIPVEVALNEVIEISKDFSTERSGKFINGILDAILKKIQPNYEKKNVKKKADQEKK
ncbi:MAG: transcription antitermination factor NusB [Calditrichaceae bacterium]|nr:transcription antitermination factor NusB [Calditrichaceae bacterium]